MIQQRKLPLASLARLLINQGVIPKRSAKPSQQTQFNHAIQEIFIKPSLGAMSLLDNLQVIEINKYPSPISSIFAIKMLIS